MRPATAPRLPYLRQVERIAPPDPPGLIDRADKLAELARFCLDPGCGSYAWWQAGPWAGKSALLSSFVLRPPPDLAAGRVRIISFFVTARLAAQDTREAFTQVMLEQLAALLGQSLPPVLTEETREAYLLDLLAQAAAACARDGGRLVLVIDGLDEDRGVTTGPDAHSIAGLLPAAPPSGMRVIVAGRPNPPVPDDVPDWHPLRGQAIIRPLAASPYAGDVRRLSRQELQRLLRGSPAEQDVLGLLTAARGGLSARDLAELAGIPRWEVEAILHTAPGRTFDRRPARWAPAGEPEVYLLGHEELQAEAVAYLRDRLPSCLARLHAWADTYRHRGWPHDTPEYLLDSYYPLLVSLGDLPRMAQCGTDPARHDRMLAMTGADTEALTQIGSTLRLAVAGGTPDLGRALALAYCRDRLKSRNFGIPDQLPAVWAALGYAARAEALAASITGTNSITSAQMQAKALAHVAEVLAQQGQVTQAEAVALRAEAATRSIADSTSRASALAGVAGALALAGQTKQAEAVARSITDSTLQARALAEVARALALTDQVRQAEAVARSITSSYQQARALAKVAGALVAAGQSGQAEAVTRDAEAVARSVTSPYEQARALADVAVTQALAGRAERAGAMAREAAALARAVAGSGYRAWALADAARALAHTGQAEQADAAAREATTRAGSLTYYEESAQALEGVVAILAQAGQYRQAEAAARRIFNPGKRKSAFSGRQKSALAKIARALALAGQSEQAEAMALKVAAEARSLTTPSARAYEVAGVARILAEVAQVLALAGRTGQAEAVALEVEAAVRSAPDTTHFHARALASVARSAARAGQYEQAETIARSITDPRWRAPALAGVAAALAQAGARDQAETVAREAEAVARSVTSSFDQPRAVAEVAVELAHAGLHEQAETIARSIANGYWQRSALADVANALALARRHRQAEALAQSVTGPGPSIHPGGRAWALADGARAAAQAGQREQAEALARQAVEEARSIPEPDTRALALARAAGALAQAGQHQQADVIAQEAAAVARSSTSSTGPALALTHVAGALAQAGQHEQAEIIALEAAAVARHFLAEHSLRAGFLGEEILTGMAEILAQAEINNPAIRLVEELCPVMAWYGVSGAVLMLDTKAYTQLFPLLIYEARPQ